VNRTNVGYVMGGVGMGRRAESGHQALSAGDEEAVRALYAEHGAALRAFALRSLGDRGKAEDVVQEALLRAWRGLDHLDPSAGSLRPWLFTVVRNLVVDEQRRAAARPRLAPTDGVVDPTTPDGVDRVLEAWQVADALRQLRPEHREVIIETYYRGGSVRETAARTGVPEGTVKSRLFYGLRALRLALEEMGVVGR
jgi:RNA polymerase sigma-70 factor (ECF subfamily)